MNIWLDTGWKMEDSQKYFTLMANKFIENCKIEELPGNEDNTVSCCLSLWSLKILRKIDLAIFCHIITFVL